MSIQIHIAQTEAERQAIYRFRYQIYIQELGKQLEKADHQQQILCEPIDENSTLFFVEEQGEIIATCRVAFGCDTAIPDDWKERFELAAFDVYPCESFAFLSRLMVARRFRGLPLTNDLLRAAYALARAKHIRFAFAHCRPPLVSLYRNMGWRIYRESFEDSEVGIQMPMVLVLEDENHLRSVNSMLLADCLNWPNHQDAPLWFADSFAYGEALAV